MSYRQECKWRLWVEIFGISSKCGWHKRIFLSVHITHLCCPSQVGLRLVVLAFTDNSCKNQLQQTRRNFLGVFIFFPEYRLTASFTLWRPTRPPTTKLGSRFKPFHWLCILYFSLVQPLPLPPFPLSPLHPSLMPHNSLSIVLYFSTNYLSHSSYFSCGARRCEKPFHINDTVFSIFLRQFVRLHFGDIRWEMIKVGVCQSDELIFIVPYLIRGK